MGKENKTFEDFKLNKQLLEAIAEQGYEEPSPIQQKAIPLILAGHDLMGIAQTGTGKTAAFVLPLLMKIKYAQGMDPRALILAPTRELAMQTHENIKKLSLYCDIRYACIYGGTGTKAQIEAIRGGIDILTATPGRFLDLYKLGEINLKKINTLVLDEADKMMDMGFMPQIRNILEVLPVKRQNLLFSATMPEKVLTLSEEFLEFPETVEITPQSTPVETVDQVLYKVPNFRTKINLLHYLLQDEQEFNKVIVFVKTKEAANNIFHFLERKVKGEVRVIHGNKDQNTRINAMEAFRQEDNAIRLLVATDVASRGIDIQQVSHVINFDVPVVYEDYVHRIGRTGRANQSGSAITFVNPAEEFHLTQIEKVIRQHILEKPLPTELEIVPTKFEESQAIAKAIDAQRMKADPTYKGAFHEKKRKNTPPKAKSFKNSRNKAKTQRKRK